MQRTIALSLTAGLLSAIFFMLVVYGGVLGAILTYLAPLPVMVIGLSFGVFAALIGGGAAALVLSIAVGGFAGLGYTVAVLAPALLVSWRALLGRQNQQGEMEWYPPGLLLSWLVVAAAALMGLATLLASGHPDGLQASVRIMLDQMLGGFAALEPDQREAVLDVWTSFFPAMTLSSWLFMTIINAVAAQGLAKRLGWARRPSPEYSALELPRFLSLALILGLALTLLGGDIGYFAQNLAALFVLPFVLLGAAGVHLWARKKQNGKAALVAFYAAIVILPWVVPVVAGFGLVRHWISLLGQGAQGSDLEEK